MSLLDAFFSSAGRGGGGGGSITPADVLAAFSCMELDIHALHMCTRRMTYSLRDA